MDDFRLVMYAYNGCPGHRFVTIETTLKAPALITDGPANPCREQADVTADEMYTACQHLA